MYGKNLSEYLAVRITREDFEFLRSVADLWGISVSDVIRILISQKRRENN